MELEKFIVQGDSMESFFDDLLNLSGLTVQEIKTNGFLAQIDDINEWHWKGVILYQSQYTGEHSAEIMEKPKNAGSKVASLCEYRANKNK